MPGTSRVDGPDSLSSAIGLEMVGEEVCSTLAGEGDVVMSLEDPQMKNVLEALPKFKNCDT